MAERIGVGMLGCGTVGTGVARLLQGSAPALADRVGAELELCAVAVRDPGRPRDPVVGAHLLTADAPSVVRDPAVDVVVEVMGGIEPARSLILEALRLGKAVVTANKELLATCGKELFEAAERAGSDLRFEGSVGGGIPLIRPLKESLAGDRVRRLLGIVNGTTNYVLWRMKEAGSSYAGALAEATALGYAEPDPTADVEGHDAAAKCAILASVAFNTRVVVSDVHREGISHLTPADIAAASRMGYTIKLLAVAEETGGEVSARVHPSMVPDGHPLAGVAGAYNAVFVESDAVGRLMFYGPGAGGMPTGAAVVGDIVEVARNLLGKAPGLGCTCLYERPLLPIEQVRSEHYVALDVADRPGVLAQVAAVFAGHGVSIRSVLQRDQGAQAQLELVTHPAQEGDMRATLAQLAQLPAVTAVARMLRVEGDEPGPVAG